MTRNGIGDMYLLATTTNAASPYYSYHMWIYESHTTKLALPASVSATRR